MPTIQLPTFSPRNYQVPLLRAMDSGYKRAVCIWHRRAGKDVTLINLVAKKAMERVGVYYYLFPTYNQGRKILWEGIDRTGKPFLDYIPKELRANTNNQEMKIELLNGSIIRVVGTDNVDSIVGTNPVGCVFSEYSLQDPRAWDFLRPILAENGGWAVFNFTPRGTNHGKQLWDIAEGNPEVWYSQKLTVDDTKAIPQDVLDNERAEMFAKTGNDALFMQEYYVSFDAPVEGAYYGAHLMAAEKEGRITSVPYAPEIPVNTFWDLGVGDSTAIWFTQNVGREIRIIDYVENSGEGLTHYAKLLQEKPYVYGRHIAPHDIQVREFTSGRSRLETAQSLGINFEIAPKVSLEDGIEAARLILPRCWFDANKTQLGLNALRSYHKDWDDKNNTWRAHPAHDWASHGADAFRYFALSHRDERVAKPKRVRHYDPHTGRPLD